LLEAPDAFLGGMVLCMRRVAVGWALGTMVMVGATSGVRAQPRDVPSSASVPRDVASESAAAGYPLRERNDGRGWEYHGVRFLAIIARDGTVTFRDHHVGWENGGLIGAAGERRYVAPYDYAEGGPAPGQPSLPAYGVPPFSTPSDQPGHMPRRMGKPDSASMRNLPWQPPLAAGGWRFDITDELMRRHQNDPYQAQKLAFLDATRGFRQELAVRYDHDLGKVALGQLPSYLDAIWSSPALTPAQKRTTLVQLRDECDDTEDGRYAHNVIDLYMRNHDGGTREVATGD
jgi:hypothetical protein